MKIRRIFLIASVLICGIIFAMTASAEVVTGHIEYTYQGDIIVDNDWSLDRDSGVMTIKSLKGGWNECGTGSRKDFLDEGGWYNYVKEIKKVVLDGNFSKISNNAFNGCINMTELVMTADITQIDQSAFLGCSSLTTVSLVGYMREEEVADLRHVSSLDKKAFKNTAVKRMFVSESKNADFGEEVFPEGLEEIFGAKGTPYETYANENGIKFTERKYTVNVDFKLNGKTYESISAPYGISMEEYGIEGRGSAICLFSDSACTSVYDTASFITEDLILHAKELLSFEGWSVRIREYCGVRAVFNFKNADTSNLGDFEISKVGAVVGRTEYALSDFTLDTENTLSIVVFENGEKVGETLGAPENGNVSFALCAVGYEGSDEEFLERAFTNIVFRGYIVISNKKTGEEYTYYTDAVGTTLAYSAERFLQSEEANEISRSEKIFVQSIIDKTAGKGEDSRYGKEKLMSLLTDIYNDNGKLLVGEEIEPGDTAYDVIERYVEKSGESPSIIGMDLACYGNQLMTATEEYKNEFLRSLIDYCRDGGVITASSHFQNPTRNWTSKGLCRGYLGKEDMWEDLITEGTALNREFKRELNVDAEFLRELGNNDVPILWRPFHEMNGNWFWWCLKQENGYVIDARSFHDAWIYMYDYYENELGLDNLIWVYSPNNDTGSLVDVEYGYPGDKYVDMTGLDWYSNGNYEIGSSENAYKRMMNYGMPAALTEYGGSGGELDSIATWNDIQKMYNDGMKVTYLLTWTSQNSFPERGLLDELMAKPDILSSTEVWQMFKQMEGK